MKKIAMLIGNDKYETKNVSLQCAVNDANDLSDKIKNLDFDVQVINNINDHDMRIEMAKFESKLCEYEVGMFFFAGHGFQFDGNNYLANTDTSFADERSTRYTAFPLDEVIRMMENSNLSVKILIIDACRQSNFGTLRGMGNGFAPVFAPKGTIIAFATSPGQAAKEANGHGYFTSAILQHIGTKKISIEELFKRVRNTVYVVSKGTQITWEHTSLMGEFTFNSIDYTREQVGYSRYALADYEYECVPNSRTYTWIEAAKTYNYNIQNGIPEQIMRIKSELKNEDKDDLFVLGRNLYQAASNAFKISNFFDSLHSSLLQLDRSVAKNILNGMTYEIYFDSKGKLRKSFKTNKYKEVLKEILSAEFVDCREFIAEKLKGYSQRVIYIPGGETIDLEIHLEEYKEDYVDKELYCPAQIFMDGINVMYNEEGVELYKDRSWYGYMGGNLDKFIECLREKIVATQRGLNIKIVADEYFDENKSEITIPHDFQLLRYSN